MLGGQNLWSVSPFNVEGVVFFPLSSIRVVFACLYDVLEPFLFYEVDNNWIYQMATSA